MAAMRIQVSGLSSITNNAAAMRARKNATVVSIVPSLSSAANMSRWLLRKCNARPLDQRGCRRI
jgi:hypothetical protein